MDVRIAMRQQADDRWSAVVELDPPCVVSEPTRERCLGEVRRLVQQAVPEWRREELTLIVEMVPQLAGVAEAAAVIGWDKRRVITYIRRGRFPAPIASLAGGRVWVRSDVEAFAREWRARQRRKGEDSG